MPLVEKIEILMILARDKEEAIRARALKTLHNWAVEELQQVLGDPSTPPAVLDFAADFLAPGRRPLLEALLQNPRLPADLRDAILMPVLDAEPLTPSEGAPGPPPEASPAPESEPGAAEAGDPERQTLIQRINAMSTVEKIKLALTGNQESRMMLIRDGNKIVARAVLQSPKLSDAEIEAYASAKNVSEEVLRLIAVNRGFMKTYSVVRALVNNPRAPVDITLRLVIRLNEKDLKTLTLNRNVPDVIRSTATKMVKQREEAAKPKIPTGKH